MCVAYKIKRLEPVNGVSQSIFYMHKQMTTTFILQKKRISKNRLKGILKFQGNGILQMVRRENLTSCEAAFLQMNFGID